ncbi:hypothetical protein MF406_12245 [Georgenia sp. TF02-10]|uniref:hypothetical protein n=1 Tax=Georgenia sp. TF02-10 TaxID=2917725 RepID=UPI001FA759AE|nr:hypothetical protein [Georgenia sp. TF02-10]UNX53752.1 hypothetical protein MF406_12245 [Georgenia sp. TF02-10]
MAVAVSVVTFVTAWNLYRHSPQPDAVVYAIPVGPVVLFGVLVLLMFRRPR